MSTRAADPRVLDGIERACARAGTPDELFEVLSYEVGKAVPFDASMWFGVDPATLLAVAPARIEAMDGDYCHTFWHGEFHDQDASLFSDLARQAVPAASLRSETADRPLRSARYREFMQPQGYDDELRAVFRSGDNTWAVAGLYREKGRPPFTADEVTLMGAISSVVGSAVRARAAAGVPNPALSAAPGLMLFDAAGVLTLANAEATRWLSEIYGPQREGGASWLDMLRETAPADLRAAVPIIPLIARARAVAAGHEEGQARLRLRDRAGRWLVLHASCLEGRAAAATVAVVVEPAKSAEIAPIVIEAYGLSHRERDVVRAVARGLSTPEIASELFLSAHTVRDYIKSVFEKVGVSSRGELVAKLFAEHYSDPMHAAMIHAD
ncbi:MAG TPA: helix-turn-helix transcriptional regulator [Acidimicrobiales bacterium]|nr:helix-turn-helix transcriptional regulator [Acidimicrobiales bacterium]